MGLPIWESTGYIDGHTRPSWVKSLKTNLAKVECHGGMCPTSLPPVRPYPYSGLRSVRIPNSAESGDLGLILYVPLCAFYFLLPLPFRRSKLIVSGTCTSLRSRSVTLQSIETNGTMQRTKVCKTNVNRLRGKSSLFRLALYSINSII